MGKMTDVEVKSHNVEANMAVRIADNQALKRSQFNWVVNKSNGKKVFFHQMLAGEPLPDTFKRIYVAACKGQKQKGGESEDPPNLSKADTSAKRNEQSPRKLLRSVNTSFCSEAKRFSPTPSRFPSISAADATIRSGRRDSEHSQRRKKRS